jgi:hypothetical protein
MELVRTFERRPGIDLARFGTGSTAITFSRDGATLAFAWNDAESVNVCRWDTSSGRKRTEASRAGGDRVRALAFTPVGELLVACGGNIVTQEFSSLAKVVPLSIWDVPRE